MAGEVFGGTCVDYPIHSPCKRVVNALSRLSSVLCFHLPPVNERGKRESGENAFYFLLYAAVAIDVERVTRGV